MEGGGPALPAIIAAISSGFGFELDQYLAKAHSYSSVYWALAEVRKQPGCSNVRDIAINRVTDERSENNWSMCVLSAGYADANTAARAALYVQHALRRDYDLMVD
jgi:hypothetical protein